MKSRVAVVMLLILGLAFVSACGQPTDAGEQQLDEKYKAELKDVDLKISKLEIVVGEGGGGARSLVIAYVTRANDDREAFDEEILSLVKPAANEEYDLVDILIVATNDGGTVSKTVSIDASDVGEWLDGSLTKEEFVQRWIVTGF